MSEEADFAGDFHAVTGTRLSALRRLLITGRDRASSGDTARVALSLPPFSLALSVSRLSLEPTPIGNAATKLELRV